jgi:hypothetical protein
MAYIYGHYRADSGKLFYIGKGTGKRAWTTSGRSKYWRSVANKYGYEVKILEDNLTEEEAYDKEVQLIAEVGLENLVNFRVGGDNPTSADMKRLYENEEYRNKIAEINAKRSREQANNPEWLAKVTAENRNRGEEFRKNVSASIQKKFDEDAEYKKRVTESNRRMAQTPEWRKKNLEVAERNKNNPEFKTKMKEVHRRNWQNPEYRKKQMELRSTPEFRKKLTGRRKKSSSNLNETVVDN